MTLRDEYGEQARNDAGTSSKLVLAGLVQAERTNRVGNSLDDLKLQVSMWRMLSKERSILQLLVPSQTPRRGRRTLVDRSPGLLRGMLARCARTSP